MERKKEVKLFYCYAREDKAYRDELDAHLSTIKRTDQIKSWSDQEIIPGTDWQRVIDIEINTASIILLLVSSSFLASEYCYSKELAQALERHISGKAYVVPIILRPVDWNSTPFSMLQVLPTDAKPVTLWPNRDEAYWDIARGIQTAVRQLVTTIWTEREWYMQGKNLNNLKKYMEALSAFDQALRLDPYNATYYVAKGEVFSSLGKNEEALSAFDQAINLDPNNATYYKHKGEVFSALEKYDEALNAFDQALRLDPYNATYYVAKGEVLSSLGRNEEALSTFDQAIHLDPNNAMYYTYKGKVFSAQEKYEEALNAYDQALRLDPYNATYFLCKGKMFYMLNRYNETLIACDQAIDLDPDNAICYMAKSSILYTLHGLKEARIEYRKAKDIDPYNRDLSFTKWNTFFQNFKI